MDIFEKRYTKRLKKGLNRGKNRVGRRKDRLRLKWTWDEVYENETNKKFIRTVAKIGTYTLTVDRRSSGFNHSESEYYSYNISIATKEFNSKKEKELRKKYKDDGCPWYSYNDDECYSPVYYSMTLEKNTKKLRETHRTRIDAQKDAEQEIYKYLKILIRDMEV